MQLITRTVNIHAMILLTLMLGVSVGLTEGEEDGYVHKTNTICERLEQ